MPGQPEDLVQYIKKLNVVKAITFGDIPKAITRLAVRPTPNKKVLRPPILSVSGPQIIFPTKAPIVP